MILCFDECLPPKWSRTLAELLLKKKKPVESFHIIDKLKHGARDDEIVAWLQSEASEAVMISGDSGKKSKGLEPRLPLLCPQLGITSIFIARKLCQVEGFEKFRMLIVCMPEIEALAEVPRGSRYRLRRSGTHGFRLEEWKINSSSQIKYDV